MPGQAIVVIVEDDLAYAESLAALIASMGHRTQAYSSGSEFLRSFDRGAPYVLIVDLRLPDLDGLSIIEAVNESPLPPPVVVLTGHADVQTAVKAMRSGVVAFLEKQTFSETALWEAIHQAVQVDAERRAKHERRETVKQRVGQLSSNELEVLKLLISGQDHTSIASSLEISRRTVENRRAKVMQKLGVATFPELISLSAEAGLY